MKTNFVITPGQIDQALNNSGVVKCIDRKGER